MKLRGLTVISALFLWIAQVPSDAGEPTQSVAQELRRAQSEAEMDQIVTQVTDERREIVKSLIDFLNESKVPTAQARACYLLGELRDPSATRTVLAHLLVEVNVPIESRRIPLWGRYPCQEALAKIGKPVESALLEVLSAQASGELEIAALGVLQRIEGGRGAVFVLEQALERAGTDERKGLDGALERARKEAP